jgi:TRAP-type mannitol/chloroaromatic compound transport system permease small subunit
MNKLYHILNNVAALIDTLIDRIGKSIALFSILLVLLTSLIVLLRYGFNIGSIALQETGMYIHAAIFMLGAAYTLQHGCHVRVDVFYRRFNERQKAWVNALGCLFLLLPTAASIILLSDQFVLQSWHIKESSIEQEGLPIVYIFKTFIPACGSLLFLQGVAMLIQNTLLLVGFNTNQPINDEAML